MLLLIVSGVQAQKDNDVDWPWAVGTTTIIVTPDGTVKHRPVFDLWLNPAPPPPIGRWWVCFQVDGFVSDVQATKNEPVEFLLPGWFQAGETFVYKGAKYIAIITQEKYEHYGEQERP